MFCGQCGASNADNSAVCRTVRQKSASGRACATGNGSSTAGGLRTELPGVRNSYDGPVLPASWHSRHHLRSAGEWKAASGRYCGRASRIQERKDVVLDFSGRGGSLCRRICTADWPWRFEPYGAPLDACDEVYVSFSEKFRARRNVHGWCRADCDVVGLRSRNHSYFSTLPGVVSDGMVLSRLRIFAGNSPTLVRKPARGVGHESADSSLPTIPGIWNGFLPAL